MAQSAKSLKATSAAPSPTQLELLPSYGHNPFWQSSLFNEVYLQNDVPTKYRDMWEVDEAGPFYEFCNQFRNLCGELKDSDLESWSERNTINRLIKPVLRMLGYFDNCSANQEPWAEDEPFSVKENGELRTYKPDLIIVSDPKELKYIERKKGQEKLDEARSSVLIPIEAKYWARIDDLKRNQTEDTKRADKKDQSDATRSLDFDEQCLKYMQILNKDYGILTDGKTWRLYNRELSSDSYRRNFQFNLGHLIKHVNAGMDRDPRDYQVFVESAKYFFHIFSKSALYSSSGERRFVDDLLEYSKKYVTKVEDDLKSRFVNAMALACNGYLRSVNESSGSADLAKIRNVAESHLFNILFIKYCESRNVLPLKQSPDYRKISISNTIDKLEYFKPEKESDNLNFPVLKRMFSKDFTYSATGTELYDRLLKLTKIVQDGTGKTGQDELEIAGFRESIFTKEEWAFVQGHKLTNSEMISILFQLGYCESDISGRRVQQIPYNFFSPRQLGSIYESFLEFKLEKAPEDMAFIKKQWVPANLSSDKLKALDVPKVKKGKLFFSPDNADRKVTGSYYTPDYAVRYIVGSTLGPVLKGKKSKDILTLKLIDPAMGSGHFLCAALNYVARAYIEALDSETNDDVSLTAVQAKRLVLHSCVYGVDINQRAVKLAKMSLWLESAEEGSSLEDLSDQLWCDDTLISEKFGPKKLQFDIVIGNPPYVNELRNNSSLFAKYHQHPKTMDYYEAKMDLFYFFIERGLDFLRDGGTLGFIIAQYWLTRAKTKKLHEKMHQDSTIQMHVNLRDNIVFDEAPGLHSSILILRKETFSKDKKAPERIAPTNFKSHTLLEEWLFSEKDLINDSLSYDGEKQKYLSSPSGGDFAGDEYSYIPKDFVQIGIDTHQEYVTKNHVAECPSLKAGEGIFVVSPKELKAIELAKNEQAFLRPFYEANQISLSGLTGDHKWLFYIDSKANKDLQSGAIKAPNIKRHFKRFERVITSDCAPFGLHRARQEVWFAKGSKVICPRKTKLPNFMWTSKEAYFNQSVAIIKTHSEVLDQIIGLILNSDFAYSRFKEMKTQGEQLQVDKEVIIRFPFPVNIGFAKFDEIAFKKEHPELYKRIKSFVSGTSYGKLEFGHKELNALVQRLYVELGAKKKARAA